MRMLPSNWLPAHFTTLLYYVSILLRPLVGLALSGLRMYTQNLNGNITLSSVIIPVAGVNGGTKKTATGTKV